MPSLSCHCFRDLLPFGSPRRDAYYRVQIIANLRFVYPQIPNIEIVTAPGCVYIVSTIEDGRHMVLYCQKYVRGFPGASHTVLKNIYRRSVREVRARIKQMRGNGNGFAGCACADPEKCRCLDATADRQWSG